MKFQMAIKTAIGLMSGTSMDGIDVALLKTDGLKKVERGAMAFFSYDVSTQNLIKQALDDAKALTQRDQRPGCLKKAEDTITRLHSEAVKEFLSSQNLNASDIDLIGFHGQTVLHRPDQALTVQLGNGRALAKESGIDTIHDMRANDMQFGGQGAPLVPVYHQALSEGLNEEFKRQSPIVFVNIGGISNITYVGDELIAFDTGPGNALIDQWVQSQAGIPYDQGGMIAAEGKLNQPMVEAYLSNGYFDKSLPKSLDRNDFLPPAPTKASVEDGARTLAHISAAAILKAVDHLPKPPGLWIIAGGGRHNPYIMQDLEKLALEQNAKVISAEEASLDGDAMEAECWAYLAVRSATGLPLTYPGTTGCSRPVSGGRYASAS